MSTVNLNPAASYDFGTQMWAMGEEPTAYVKYETSKHLCVEPDTVTWAWWHIDADFNRYCEENAK